MTLYQRLFKWYFKRDALPYWGILILDCAVVAISLYLVGYFQYGGLGFTQHFWPITRGIELSLVLFIIAFRIFHTYIGIIRFSSFVDLKRVFLANLCATAATLMLSVVLLYFESTLFLLPKPLYCIAVFIIATLLMWMMRIFVKNIYDTLRIDSKTRKIFIYGSGPAVLYIAEGLNTRTRAAYSLAGFVCPKSTLVGSTLMGVKVYEDNDDIVSLMKKVGAYRLFVSPTSVEKFRDRQSLIDRLVNNGIKIMMISRVKEWTSEETPKVSHFKEVGVEDLLPREQLEIDMNAVAVCLRGKRILITGAAGSIGSEIVRQVAALKPEELILVDQAETPMHSMRMIMAAEHPDVKAHTIVVSITNQNYMEELFAEYRPQYVFHAAAYKHVPMMEDNPAIAVQNNIHGTRIVADLAVKYGADKFVMISTDKAVNPTSVMGCSKRICEIYCQSLNAAIQMGTIPGKTQFVTTRFGNVLGSNGSVVPIFKEQIKNGGPITITHPDIIRFFMLIPEACKLVLEAAAIGKGGEVFVFDMGQPVKIVDLAKRMIALSGNPDVEIKYVGLRDGEKLYEEVLTPEEKSHTTTNSHIFIAHVKEYDYNESSSFEEAILERSKAGSSFEIEKMMKEFVPEYRKNNSEYELQ